MAFEGYRNPQNPCSTRSGTERLSHALDFTHQLVNVSFGVAKRAHPEIVSGHGGDQPRRGYNRHAQVDQTLMGGREVRDAEVEDGTRMIKLRRFGGAEHQPNASTIKEREVGGGEEQWQTQRVAIECGGARQVVNDDGDLADVLDAQARRSGAHG